MWYTSLSGYLPVTSRIDGGDGDEGHTLISRTKTANLECLAHKHAVHHALPCRVRTAASTRQRPCLTCCWVIHRLMWPVRWSSEGALKQDPLRQAYAGLCQARFGALAACPLGSLRLHPRYAHCVSARY